MYGFCAAGKGRVTIFLATAKGRATIFHARPCWGSQFFNFFFNDACNYTNTQQKLFFQVFNPPPSPPLVIFDKSLTFVNFGGISPIFQK
jgi:hypothetical protein